MRTRRLARTTASIGLVLLAGALAAGPVSAQQQDVIGIWFDAGARQDSIATTVSGEEVTAYLAILNPSVAFAISGWECRVEVAGEGIAVEEWELAEGLNIDEPPSFQVGIERYHELIAAPVVVLARVRLTVAGPQSRGWLYVHPYHPASLQDPPGSGHPRPVCVYAPTADPSDLKPLAWASGSEAWPVAVINPGEAGPVCHPGTDALRFGFVALGEAREEPLALVNVGGAPFAGEVAAPADPAFSLAAGGGAFVLGPGERRDIVVRYAPAAAGPDTAGLAACAEVLLAGGAYEAGSCGVTPQALDFGEVRQGEESCLGFTVANASDRFVAGRVDEVAPPFRLASGGGEFFLAPGESRDVVVCFAPAAMAPAFGSVTVSSCGAQVALQGMGGEALPRCVVAPPRLDFGSLVAGQAAELSFSIRNDGGYRLNGTVGALAVPFAVVAGGGAFSLAAQESLAVTVRYAPTAPGQHSAGLGLGTDQCGPVVCTGGVPRCALSTTALDFGAVGLGDVGSRSLTIRNSGGGVLEGEVELSAPPFALPAAPGGRLPYRLAAGAAMAIQVSYTPPEIAAHEATLQAGGACGPVALRGSGVEPQPVCQVSPAALEFGSVTVGTAAERLITIRNAGTGLMSGNVHAECEAFSLVDGGGEFTVGGGQSHVARVRFTPTGHGEARCTVALGTHGCFDVQARGTGLAPLCRLAPAALDFGGVAVGEARSRSFVVSNVGSLPLGGTIALASPDFSLALGGGAFTLQPGQQRTVSVRFQPTGPGAKAGAVETGLGACGTLPCAGTADYAICAIAPEALDFGVVRLGQAADSGFTVTNTGTVPFTAAVSSSSDEFRVTGIGYWLTLDPGAARFIGVVCEPESAGVKVAAIRIGTGWREVACTALATNVECSVSPTALDFGTIAPGETADRSFTIANDGLLPASGTVALSGDDAFVLAGGGGAYVLEPGQTRDVVVRFAPGADGPWSASVAAGVECGSVACSGIAESTPPVCELTPARLDFGYAAVGSYQSRSVTVRNIGGGALVGTPALSGPHFQVIAGRRLRLGPGEALDVVVRYGPLAGGAHADTLRPGAGLPVAPCTGYGLADSLDCLGVFFDADGTRNEHATSASFASVTAYLTLLGPSVAAGVSGWECAVEIAGDVAGTSWTCEGGAFNLAVPPLFQVGLTGEPLPWRPAVVLATARFLQASPAGTTRIFVHPYSQPSLPGFPAYAAGDDPGHLVPLGWLAGSAATPVAVVNGSPADSAATDVLGVYFDREATRNRLTATVDGETVTAYLVLVNPAHGYPSLAGWEACVELSGAAQDPVWEIADVGINAVAAPCFRVTYPGEAPAPGERVVLATLRFVQAHAYEATEIRLRPLPDAALPGSLSYRNRQLPHLRFALAWSSGDEALPVAVVEPGTAPPPPPEPASSTGLLTVYPNPCNPEARVEFELAQGGRARLEVFDLAGRRVRVLCDETLPAGPHARRWNGRNDEGRVVPSGTYYLRLAAGGRVDGRTVTLLK